MKYLLVLALTMSPIVSFGSGGDSNLQKTLQLAKGNMKAPSELDKEVSKYTCSASDYTLTKDAIESAGERIENSARDYSFDEIKEFLSGWYLIKSVDGSKIYMLPSSIEFDHFGRSHVWLKIEREAEAKPLNGLPFRSMKIRMTYDCKSGRYSSNSFLSYNKNNELIGEFKPSADQSVMTSPEAGSVNASLIDTLCNIESK